MNYHSAFWQNRRRLTSLVVGILFLVTAAPVYAKYQPKNRKPASGYSRGGGSRGCVSDGIPLTLLAPNTFVGKTASKRPMFAWYMSNSQNVRFRLFEFESDTRVKQIAEIKEIPTAVGINKLKLPKEYSLTPLKTYLWQIAIKCESFPIVNRAEFTVVDSDSVAKNKFTTIPERVKYYAENELWYEALEAALVENNRKLSQTASTLVEELAESEMLTGSQAQIAITKQRIANLEKISGS